MPLGCLMSAGDLPILVLTFLMCHIYVYSILVVSPMKCRYSKKKLYCDCHVSGENVN